ncbi:MAG TPA: DUF1800 domain-containing protein [Lutibacter sp.]|nr:DUF1800 domain-containing protein [Lutibacter sp.]
MKYILSSIVFLCYASLFSQEYTDYVGAGHAIGITVSSSSEQSRTDWNEVALAENTINGNGLDARLLKTSRFLAQTTFGTNLEYIKTVSQGSFEDWIDNQFTLNSNSLGQLTESIYEDALEMWTTNGGDPVDYFGPEASHFLYAWWQNNMNNDDLLRQRVALALSEIMVISTNSDLANYGNGIGYYYDMLAANSFGNFKDLLLDVSLHPMMGYYLSHYNNPKSNPSLNIHPDENYAREIMQLFSIGLHELNNDGSYVLDANDQRVPTYDNDDIKEFAKVFTGLGVGDVIENVQGITPEFGLHFWWCKKDTPMAVYEDWHEQGEKHLLNGFTIPSGQAGMQDIEMAVNHLFNHPNVGPFLAKRLIQRLIKSNPTPQYINHVASAFNNTAGVRGNMQAVIKAILLHNEARTCGWVNHPDQGKLKEPMMRYFNLARQIDRDTPSGLDWNVGYWFYISTGQAPLSAPSVFNFFLPDFKPNGEIADNGLVAPEFQIHNSSTSIGYVNIIDYFTSPEWIPIFETWDLELEDATLNFDSLQYWAKDPEVLINHLDKLFTSGLLSQETREIIRDAITPIQGSDPDIDYMYYRVKMALYLLFISPDYAIQK